MILGKELVRNGSEGVDRDGRKIKEGGGERE